MLAHFPTFPAMRWNSSAGYEGSTHPPTRHHQMLLHWRPAATKPHWLCWASTEGSLCKHFQDSSVVETPEQRNQHWNRFSSSSSDPFLPKFVVRSRAWSRVLTQSTLHLPISTQHSCKCQANSHLHCWNWCKHLRHALPQTSWIFALREPAPQHFPRLEGWKSKTAGFRLRNTSQKDPKRTFATAKTCQNHPTYSKIQNSALQIWPKTVHLRHHSS